MELNEVAPDIHVLTGKSHSSNIVVVAGKEGALLIDAMGSLDDAEALRRFIADDLRSEVRTLISTHYYGDHTAGLKSFPEARIIAHETYAQTAALWPDKAAMERDFVPASVLVSSRMTLPWGRYTLEIFHNPGHTMSTLNIDVEGADLLVVGDTVVANVVCLNDADPVRLPVAIRRAKERGRSRIVSGHDGVQPARCLDNAIFYYNRLLEAGSRGITAPDVSALTPPGVTLSDTERFVHGLNMQLLAAGGIQRFLRAPAPGTAGALAP